MYHSPDMFYGCLNNTEVKFGKERKKGADLGLLCIFISQQHCISNDNPGFGMTINQPFTSWTNHKEHYNMNISYKEKAKSI